MSNSVHKAKGFADHRSNISEVPEQEQENQEKQIAWRNLLFGLCFFHAVI